MTKKFSETFSFRDRDQAKFMSDADDNIATRIANVETAPLHVQTKELVQGVDYDRVDATYPATDTEIFTYSKDGTDILTVTVTYQSSAKRNISSVVYL